MRRKVLATLADKKHLEQAKSLFAAAHFKGGWCGDYLLLAYNIDDQDLSWFYKKNIDVKHCKPLDKYDIKKPLWGHIFLTKLYLFQPDMKKWSKILYMDTDCLIRGDINSLTRVKGIGGVPFYNGNYHIFFKGNKIRSKDLFISGTYCFSTSLIKSDTFNKLLLVRDELYQEFSQGVSRMANDELIYRLYFGKKFKRFPLSFNIIPSVVYEMFRVSQPRVKGVIIHCTSLGVESKPWDKSSYFYKEWKGNLDKADKIDINNPLPPAKKWSVLEIWFYQTWLKYVERPKVVINIFFFRVDRLTGLLGLQIKKYFPNLYERIRLKK